MIWEGHYWSLLGLGEAARHYALALDELGMAVSARCVEWTDDRYLLSSDTTARLEGLLAREAEPGEVRVQHVLPPSFQHHAEAAANVGCTTFDADGIPRSWAAACNRMDEIWVPSRFCLEAFSASGVPEERIRVIPHGVDSARFAARVEPLPVCVGKHFTFLSVFDWVQRKGWDVLLRAYLSEFHPSEDVCLLIRATRLDTWQLRDFVAREFAAGPRPAVVILPFAVPEAAMPSLYALADAFVLPSRGEGWGIPFGEAMAAGLPTIATRWGGNLDFMDDDNSFLIDIEGLVPIDRELQAQLGAEPGLRQAEPSVDHLAQTMRWVFEHQKDARAKGRAARATMRRHFTWQHAAVKIAARIEALGEHHNVPLRGVAARLLDRGSLSSRSDAAGIADLVVERLAELEEVDALVGEVLQAYEANRKRPRRRREPKGEQRS